MIPGFCWPCWCKNKVSGKNHHLLQKVNTRLPIILILIHVYISLLQRVKYES